MKEIAMHLIESIRRIARTTRWWVSLRRAQREGWWLTFKKLQTWPRILRTPPVRTAQAASSEIRCEVHLLCSERDYLSAIWAIKSFYSHVGVDALPLTIHLDHAMPAKAIRRLKRQLPDARIVGRVEADGIVTTILERRKLFRLAAARKASPFILKLTDFVLLSSSANIISFDSDVLFFARPEELLQATQDGFAGALVQTDLGGTYNIDSERARALGWQLPERVNTGIMAFAKNSVDLEACDQLLADAEVARVTGWIEQTLFALLFERTSALRFLPSTYTIPVAGENVQGEVIARHYAGLSRPLLTLEGMPLVLGQR